MVITKFKMLLSVLGTRQIIPLLYNYCITVYKLQTGTLFDLLFSVLLLTVDYIPAKIVQSLSSRC